MSAVEERRLTRKRRVVIGVAAGLAATLVAGVTLTSVLAPERVDPSEVSTEYQPPRVAANDAAVAAPADADFAEVEDVTDELINDFTGDISFARSTVQGGEEKFPYAEPDQCLLDWAKANLAELAAKGTYEVVTVCDRPTAVLAGPDGADTKVLVYGALEDTAPEGAMQLIGESEHDRMAFAAVRSADGKAQLLATSELPDPE